MTSASSALMRSSVHIYSAMLGLYYASKWNWRVFCLISKIFFGLDKSGFHIYKHPKEKEAKYSLYKANLFTHTFIIETYIYGTQSRLGSI